MLHSLVCTSARRAVSAKISCTAAHTLGSGPTPKRPSLAICESVLHLPADEIAPALAATVCFRGRPRGGGPAQISQASDRKRTSRARHWSQRSFRLHGMARKWSWSACVQQGLVVWAHVRRFQISRTAFAVMPNCVARLVAKVSRTSRSALARKIWIACARVVCDAIQVTYSDARHGVTPCSGACMVSHARHTSSVLSFLAGLVACLVCAAMRGASL